jgi:adenylylsulfate kinase-like enzyme
MRQIHFGDAPSRRAQPKVSVLTGLGGSGKTQIALKFASEFEERYGYAMLLNHESLRLV